MRTENDRSLLGFLARGVTTTHPLCSVFTLLILSVFIFVCASCHTLASAEAFPIPPVWLPMNPYNAQGLEGNYVLLNDDQKEIVKEIIGAVNVVNLGFGQYVLMNPISGIANTRQFLREYGGTFLETFWSQVMGTSRAMTDFVGSTIYKASTYETVEEYEADTAPSVASGSQKYFQISPELTVAFKNWYRVNGGVEDWQNQVKPFETTIEYDALPISSGVYLQQYENYISQYSKPAKYNINYNRYHNGVIDLTDAFVTTNLFINTTNREYYFCDNNGNRATSSTNTRTVSVYFNTNGSVYSVDQGGDSYNFNVYTYDYGNFSTYLELVRYIFNNTKKSLNSNQQIFLTDAIQHVYVGADWSSKQEIFNIDDLNIGSTPSEYIDNIPDTGYVDINKLIGQIADEVVNLREVVEESVLVKDGTDAIPYSDALTKAIDKYMTEPESKVVIISTLFKGLGKYITYLYEQAKPLVLYTRDLLTALTFDGTGLSWVFYGAVSCGLIGGVLCKFLL